MGFVSTIVEVKLKHIVDGTILIFTLETEKRVVIQCDSVKIQHFIFICS